MDSGKKTMKMRFISSDDLSPATDYVVSSLESRLEEILVIAYETAVEAGLEPRQAFALITRWLASEQALRKSDLSRALIRFSK